LEEPLLMPRRIVTTEDIKTVAQGELSLPADAIVTDSARELAAERGVRIQIKGAPSGTDEKTNAPALRTVAIGSDHGGYELKEYLKQFLASVGYTVQDLGTNSTEAVDYPDFARAVAESVASGRAWRGIVVDAAGIGSAIAANKIAGVRAAPCYDRATARNSREHNDANVLSLGARLMQPEQAREITAIWLETRFAGGRHQKRVDKIVAMEQKPAAGSHGGEELPTRGGEIDSESRQKLVDAVILEVLCKLGDTSACALRGLEIDDTVCPGCDGRCAEACPEKARRVVAAGAARLQANLGSTQIPSDLARYIDHTLLKPEASETDIRQLCAEAREYGFASVCINPSWVSLCATELQGTPVKVCTVAGFPLGATTTSVKAFEGERVVKLGATEVDMVINIGALKSGYYDRVEHEIRVMAETCHGGGAILKVILETALLTDQEKVIASRLARAAGADFVKTSTGFSKGGATAHDVELMRLVVGPEMGVKAAGGIRNYEDFRKMLAAGATRIGASAGVKIMHEASGEAPEPRPAPSIQSPATAY
jgi:deoxyribose-phosphate aldolase